jgi:hypothetical protein
VSSTGGRHLVTIAPQSQATLSLDASQGNLSGCGHGETHPCRLSTIVPVGCWRTIVRIPRLHERIEESIQQNNCLVLFPTDDARTFEQIEAASETLSAEKSWDLVVVDGTWSQARKLHSRYLQNTAGHVQLSDSAVATLAQSASEESREGHQMRRHPIKWKEVSTLEATRLFLGDMMTSSKERPWDMLALYQQKGDAAAIKQLGPHRMSPKATGAAQ